MNFLSKLLQGLAYIPGVVTGVENLFGRRRVQIKKMQRSPSFKPR